MTQQRKTTPVSKSKPERDWNWIRQKLNSCVFAPVKVDLKRQAHNMMSNSLPKINQPTFLNAHTLSNELIRMNHLSLFPHNYIASVILYI